MKSHKNKVIIKIAGILLVLLLLPVILLLPDKFFLFFPKPALKDSYRKELAELGVKCMPSNDVPCAAILVFNDSIIGRGFNTVNKEHLAGGHADINAISDALSKMGLTEFKKLDRSKLVLYTTFEPCTMCRGAFEEYRIDKVVFLKKKPFFEGLKVYYHQLKLDWFRRKGNDDQLQDSLFRLYPGYRG